MIVVVALPLALIVKESPPGSADAAPRAERPTASHRSATSLRRPAFYLLMIGSMCSIAAVGGANQHLKLYLSLDHGYTQARRGGSRVAHARGEPRRTTDDGLARRPLAEEARDAAHLSARRRRRSRSCCYASTRGAVTLFAIVFGIGLGGEYMVIPLMAAELFGTRVLGRAMGIVLAADGVAEATAPVLVGRLHDVSGSYVTRLLGADRLRARREPSRSRCCRAASRRRARRWRVFEHA